MRDYQHFGSYCQHWQQALTEIFNTINRRFRGIEAWTIRPVGWVLTLIVMIGLFVVEGVFTFCRRLGNYR